MHGREATFSEKFSRLVQLRGFLGVSYRAIVVVPSTEPIHRKGAGEVSGVEVDTGSDDSEGLTGRLS